MGGYQGAVLSTALKPLGNTEGKREDKSSPSRVVEDVNFTLNLQGHMWRVINKDSHSNSEFLNIVESLLGRKAGQIGCCRVLGHERSPVTPSLESLRDMG